MAEMWKSIAGYERLYEVSDFGNVRNVSTGYILKPQADKAGYCRVNLYKDKKMTHKSVHRLVAAAFIPNMLSKPEVNHKDGNKANNAAVNLEWVTPKENIKHSIASGLRNITKPVDMFTLAGDFVRTFESVTAASKFCGAYVQNICRSCARNGETTVRGYRWKYHKGENENG